mgnify:CR=1 FL=1
MAAKNIWKPLISLIFIAVIIFGLILGANWWKESRPTIYVLKIEGPIFEGMSSFIKRAVKEAEEKKAKAIVLYINTTGGYVQTAKDMVEYIGEATMPVFSYVHKKAISAGALLAYSGRKMRMSEGSVIGDAQMIGLDGKPVTSEKLVTAWRSYFRTVAETNGYDPKLAEAMVDPDISIEEVVKKGQLLTLTALEAQRLKQAKVVKSLNEALSDWGLEKHKLIMLKPNSAEGFVSLLSDPLVSQLLLTFGFLGILVEMFTPGWGIAGTIGVVCLGLFFGGRLMAGLAGYETAFLFTVGVILLAAELFLIPGFGITGISGIAAIIGSILLSYQNGIDALISLGVTLVSITVVFIWLWRYMRMTNFWNRMVLQTSLTTDQGYNVTPQVLPQVGETGLALTVLRPAGAADFDGKRIDVVTEGVFLPAGVKIKVIRIEGNRVIVTRA